MRDAEFEAAAAYLRRQRTEREARQIERQLQNHPVTVCVNHFICEFGRPPTDTELLRWLAPRC